MQLHEIKPIHKLKKKKRIGRGGKRGTYCGKGIKGQTSRAGARIRPEIRDLIKKIPKKRGA
jgi:large subunit ribosomal protein L15